MKKNPPPRKRQYCEKRTCHRFGYVMKVNLTPTRTLDLCPFCRAQLAERLRRRAERKIWKEQGFKNIVGRIIGGASNIITDNINNIRDLTTSGKTRRERLDSGEYVTLYYPWYGIEKQMTKGNDELV